MFARLTGLLLAKSKKTRLDSLVSKNKIFS